jgi:hypothetical protein
VWPTEARQFLLEAATARYVLYLDGDVLCEPGLLDQARRVGSRRQSVDHDW